MPLHCVRAFFMQRTQKILITLLSLMVITLGYLLYKATYNSTSAATIDNIINKVKYVNKLITVEGHYASVYTYEDNPVGIDNTLSNFFFKQKAVINISGKVSAGFDLEAIEYTLNQSNKTVIFHHIPRPYILSIEPTLKFYSLEDGLGNRFDESIHTKFNQQAKVSLKAEAIKSNLLEEAERQGLLILSHLKSTLEQLGWQVIIEEVKG